MSIPALVPLAVWSIGSMDKSAPMLRMRQCRMFEKGELSLTDMHTAGRKREWPGAFSVEGSR